MNQAIYRKAEEVASSSWFQKLIIIAILFSAILLGLETNQDLISKYGATLILLDQMILAFFVIEVVIKMVARGPRPWHYFSDPWNVIDFTIVVTCLVPASSNALAVFRLVRVLRVFRLITAMPKLQLIVGALLKSIPSMSYVVVLLSVHLYMFGVLGTFLFSKNDPLHFGSLGKTLISLFQVLTLEGWADLMKIQIYGCANYGYEAFTNQCVQSQAQPFWAVSYFIAFIVFGTMIILNLLIGVVVNGMADAQKESAPSSQLENEPLEISEIRALREDMRKLQSQIRRAAENKQVNAVAAQDIL